MIGAPRADLASLLPHLADTPRRMTELIPVLAQAHLPHAERIARIHGEYFASMMERAARPITADDAGADTPPWFALLRDLHDLQSRWIEAYIDALELEPVTAGRIRFALRQWIEARNPENFPGTNADVLRETLATGGDNLLRGQRNWQMDQSRGRMTMSDESAFAPGKNIAMTPGAVVFENDLIQLIRYRPTTPQVLRTPLLIVPPFINKYYILDLKPANSFVRFAVEQGLQVFMISWRNIGAAEAALTWDDYVALGVEAAIDNTLELSRTRSLHALGFCVGGTLLASALGSSVSPAKAASLTLLACLLDFSDVGDIGHYIDEAFAARLQEQYAQGGVVPGAQLAAAFASLRPRELVWKFFIGNYLLGKTPPAFDLLHWNSDSANLPGRLFAWYVQELYLRNRLKFPGTLSIRGTPVDLSRLAMPAYILGTELDHIVPWRSAYASTQILTGERQFVLGSSGHVGGIVSPPTASRRNFRVGAQLPADADAWLRTSTPGEGSWWPHWSHWLRGLDGSLRRAPRQLGDRTHSIVEPAPGRYVTETPA